MPLRPIRLRRIRRTDFAAVQALLAGMDGAADGGERAVRSRFRRLVADLGADIYLATIDEAVCGLVHVTYARHLLGPARATLELLVVAAAARRRGVGRALLAYAGSRARRRGCHALVSRGVPDDARGFFARIGWREAGTQLQFDLPAGAD
jgi:GNAT superfamily N-acetyltransferase